MSLLEYIPKQGFRKKIVFHLLFWAFYIGYHAISNYLSYHVSMIGQLLISFSLLHIPFTYITYFLGLRYFNTHKNYLLLFIWLLNMVLIYILLSYCMSLANYYLWNAWLFNNNHLLQKFNWDFITGTLDMYFMTCLPFALLYWYAERSIKNLQRYQKAELEKVKTEYDYLKSQINPHFLYNTLDFFYARTLKQDKPTANGIAVLADIMRYSLNTGGDDGQISLEEEAHQIDNYIYLQQQRFENRLFIHFEKAHLAPEASILPHALLTLVENAFKHGVTDDPQNPVRIYLTATENRIFFELTNKSSYQKRDQAGSGIGLQNLRKRLEMLYPNRHRYEILQDQDRYTSRLEIFWMEPA